ncbi:hypothetical protein NDU88_005887 [Pleurodeles waltl]|uniref:Uncharacterized protein n=1 Tax=Pleurodeles waltl TaxID=8319 RepID=A0AAV7MBB0_PLEWA|nr:hypothetical protein NDU88_005887 [Pleurodeles waltl]
MEADRQKNTQESGTPGSVPQSEEASGGHGKATLFLSDAPTKIRGPDNVISSPMEEWVVASIDTQGHLRPWPSKERKEVQTHKDKKHPKESHQEKRPGTSKGNQSRHPRDSV